MPPATRYIRDPRLDAQRLVIYKSLKRFERLKIDYAKQYRNGLRKDSVLLRAQRQQSHADSLEAKHGEAIWAQIHQKQAFQNQAVAWKKKAQRRKINFIVLLSLALFYATFQAVH